MGRRQCRRSPDASSGREERIAQHREKIEQIINANKNISAADKQTSGPAFPSSLLRPGAIVKLRREQMQVLSASQFRNLLALYLEQQAALGAKREADPRAGQSPRPPPSAPRPK